MILKEFRVKDYFIHIKNALLIYYRVTIGKRNILLLTQLIIGIVKETSKEKEKKKVVKKRKKKQHINNSIIIIIFAILYANYIFLGVKYPKKLIIYSHTYLMFKPILPVICVLHILHFQSVIIIHSVIKHSFCICLVNNIF